MISLIWKENCSPSEQEKGSGGKKERGFSWIHFHMRGTLLPQGALRSECNSCFVRHYRSVTCRYFCLPSLSLLKKKQNQKLPGKKKHVLENISRFIFVFQRNCRVRSTVLCPCQIHIVSSINDKTGLFFSFQLECLRMCHPEESLRESKSYWLLNSAQLLGWLLSS